MSKEQMVPYVIAEPCVDCIHGTCADVCPADCIHRDERMFYIDPDQCVTCGACEWACPVEAIYHEDDLPDVWRHYAAINAELSRSLGDTERAGACGPTPADHPVVATPILAGSQQSR